MKRTILFFLALLLVIILAACGGKASGENTTSGDTTKNNPSEGDSESAGWEFETPLVMQLMLGTVKLEETEYPIDAEQAAALLPLWQALRSLASSDTTAQAEMDAVIVSIQDGMTAEQMATIEAMELTMRDFQDVAETLGIDTGFGGRFGEMTPEMQATMEAAGESGEGRPGGFGPGEGFGGGIGPGGGLGPGGSEGITPEMRETAMAERSGSFNRGFGINSALLDAIIAFLEAK
jgi:hypothetical protein